MLKNCLKMGVLIAALIVGNTAFACNHTDLVKKDAAFESKEKEPLADTSESKNG